MNIKTKLRLGFGFLFALVLLIGSAAAYYLNDISKTSEVILKDNFESLTFARQMRQILDENSVPFQKVQ